MDKIEILIIEDSTDDMANYFKDEFFPSDSFSLFRWTKDFSINPEKYELILKSDIVIVDVSLKDDNDKIGISMINTIAKIKNNFKAQEIPIIAFSRHKGQEYRQPAYENGALYYVNKGAISNIESFMNVFTNFLSVIVKHIMSNKGVIDNQLKKSVRTEPLEDALEYVKKMS